ncbi:MAG: hypothetical protein WC102_04930 [Saccharofermentanales bacterium]
MKKGNYSNMILFFEGVDKSGKSTLIKNYKEKLGQWAAVYKNSFVKPSDAGLSFKDAITGFYAGLYEGFLFRANTEISLVDRSHITEIVYAPIKRGYDADIPRWRQIEKIFATLEEAAIVYVDTSNLTLAQRHEIEPDDYIKIEEIVRIKQGYEDYFASNTLLPVIRINGDATREEMLDELSQKIDEHFGKKD